MSLVEDVCFNPCFSGSTYLTRCVCIQDFSNMLVSILVLVEVLI